MIKKLTYPKVLLFDCFETIIENDILRWKQLFKKIISINNWNCFAEIIEISKRDQISLKATLAVSPNYLLNGEENTLFSKVRIVSDACFR